MVHFKRTVSMRKFFISFSMILIILCSTVQAFEASDAASVGIEGMYYGYKERSSKDNSPFMKLDGAAVGVNLSIYDEQVDHFYQLSGRFVIGQSRYVGSYQKGNYGNLRLNNTKDSILESQFIIGPNFLLNFLHFYSSPYLGIGYRYKTDHGKDKSSYLRESNYIYLPLGIRLLSGVGGLKDKIGFFVEYDFLAKSYHKSHLNQTIKNKQRKGYGAKIGFLFQEEGIQIKPFLNLWKIKDSDISCDEAGSCIVEPRNKTIETGISFAFIF